MSAEEKRSKAVLITGCSTGIGKATAERLVQRGWTVYATARNPETLESLKELGCQTMALNVDDSNSVESAVWTVEEAEGAVGALINNAGFSQSGAVEEVPLEAVRRQFETNVFGPIRLIQRVLPKMREQKWGRIVNISSMGGKLVFPGGGYYHATKYALEAISDALRFETKGFGIRTVVIEPGLIRTDFAKNVVKEMEVIPQDGGPYGEFNSAVRKLTVEGYEKGPTGWMTVGPERVAHVIEKALSAPNPKPRYKVGLSAHVLMAQRRFMPDRAWDGFLRTQFPQPK